MVNDKQLNKEIWISTSIRDETTQTMSRWEVSVDYGIRLHTYSFLDAYAEENKTTWYKSKIKRLCTSQK